MDALSFCSVLVKARSHPTLVFLYIPENYLYHSSMLDCCSLISGAMILTKNNLGEKRDRVTYTSRSLSTIDEIKVRN